MNKSSILCVLAVAGSVSCPALAQEAQLVKFGLITDTHVCDKPDQASTITVTAAARYFTGGPAKIEAFAQAMNTADAAFVAELGDFTDNPTDTKLPYDKRREAALGYLKTAEAKLSAFKGPRYHVIGNHDTDQLSKEDVAALVQNSGIALPAGQYHYSWTVNGVHFVALDAGYKTDGAPYSGVPGTPGAGYTWDDANVPAAQLEWLKADLAANKLPTVLLTHQQLNPQDAIEAGFDTKHYVKQAAEIRSVLEKSGQVIAVFSGHWHDGGHQVVNGIPYVVLQANVAYGNDASYHNQYATIEIRHKGGKDYRTNVIGHGMQKTYILEASMK